MTSDLNLITEKDVRTREFHFRDEDANEIFFPESFAIKRSFETHVDGVGLVEELQKKFPEF